MGLLFESQNGVKFYYCDSNKLFNSEEVLEFVDLIKAVSFMRAKTKNINGYWQIFCLNNKAKTCGVILTNSNKIRLMIFKELTKDEYQI